MQELDDFREELARGYKRKNPELDSAELTEVTQSTLDRQIDNLVYELYDLTPEEIAIVEDDGRK